MGLIKKMALVLAFAGAGLALAAEEAAAPGSASSTEALAAPQPAGGAVESGASANSLDKADSAGFVLGQMDFGEAYVSMAGPAAMYIRSVKIGGSPVSLLFRKESDAHWKLVETIPEEKNYFQSGTVLDFASLSKLDNGELVIDGIVQNGKAYKLNVTLNPDNSLSLSDSLQAGSFVGNSLARAKPTAGLAMRDELDKLGDLDKKYDESQRVNQEILSKIGNLESANQQLTQEKSDLLGQIKELGDRNQALTGEVASLKGEIDGYKTDLAAAKSALDQANAQAAQAKAAGDQAAGDKVAAAPAAQQYNDEALRAMLANLSAAVDKLQDKVGGLDQKLDRLSDKSLTTVKAGATETQSIAPNADLDALKAEIKRLTDLNQQLMNERADIERTLRSKFLASGYIETIKPLLAHTELKGFAGASSKIGAWQVSEAAAVQPSSGQYFAQLNLPLAQQGKTMLYSFTAKSTGKGWVGVGLHIYAENSVKKGYGHGKSILVWLTRDPDYYKTNRTYLQLYKSDDDVNMGRVLDSAIEESVSQDLRVEVLYQPLEEYITVAINGVEKIRYKTWFGLTKGVEVALRSLDAAEFRDLEVSSDGQ